MQRKSKQRTEKGRQTLQLITEINTDISLQPVAFEEDSSTMEWLIQLNSILPDETELTQEMNSA